MEPLLRYLAAGADVATADRDSQPTYNKSTAD
jgi:hypothetical protein